MASLTPAIAEDPDPITRVTDLLSQGDTERIVEYIKQQDTSKLSEISWDIIPKICEFLSEKIELDNPKVIDACEELLLHLATTLNPKEVLLVLLEQVDSYNNDIKFKSLLPSIQKCLLSLPSKRGHSIGICLETIYAHTLALPLPEDHHYEGEQRKLLDLDPNVIRINDVISSVLNFLKPFCEDLSWQQSDAVKRKERNREIRELTGYLIKLLDQPMCHLDLSFDKDNENASKSTSRVCAERLVGMLGNLHPDFNKTLIRIMEDNEVVEKGRQRRKNRRVNKVEDVGADDMEDLHVEESLPLLGLSVFAYLVFGERVASDNLPQVLSSQYLLQFCCSYIATLLSKEESLIVFKGVSLFSSLIDVIPRLSLPGSLLELPRMTDLIRSLTGAMTSCPVKELRHFGAKLLPAFLSRFEYSGRYRFYQYLMHTNNHSGLAGFTIQLLKEEIDQNLKLPAQDEHFTGPKLEKLLYLVYSLPNGEKTDLLEHSDRIMAALNLIRYMVLRDPPQVNVTGFWNLVPRIENDYCGLLRTGINMSRAHYEMEMDRIKKGELKEFGTDTTFTVGGTELPSLEKDQQIQAMQMAIHTFDMLQSILGRVTDLIEQQRRQEGNTAADDN